MLSRATELTIPIFYFGFPWKQILRRHKYKQAIHLANDPKSIIRGIGRNKTRRRRQIKEKIFPKQDTL